MRVASVDIAKGIAITLVVFGHCERGLRNARLLEDVAWVRAVDAWIYTWHVPVFFLAAGLFIAEAAQRMSLREYSLSRLTRLGWPYLVWAPLQYVVQAVAPSNHRKSIAEVWTVFHDPPMQFWFLSALLISLLLFGLAWKAGAGRLGFLGLSLALFAAQRFLYLPLGWSVLYRVSEFLPFLAVGVLLGRPDLRQRLGALGAAQAALITLGGFAIVSAAVAFDLTQQRELVLPVGLAGCAGVLGLSTLVQHTPLGAGLSVLGVRSLEIFIAHTIASAGVRVVLQRLLGVTSVELHLLVGTVTGLAVPLALAVFAERRMPWLFAWPARAVQPRAALADGAPSARASQ